jgi:hypothetical protein
MISIVSLRKIANRFPVKIGLSNNPIKRLSVFQTGNHRNLFLLFQYPVDNIAVEKKLHNEYKKQNITGEWFYLTGKDINKIIASINKF